MKTSRFCRPAIVLLLAATLPMTAQADTSNVKTGRNSSVTLECRALSRESALKSSLAAKFNAQFNGVNDIK